MPVVLAQDDFGLTPAVHPEEGDSVTVGLIGESRKAFRGFETKARNDGVSEGGEPSNPERLLRHDESPQDVRIVSGAQWKSNGKCVH